MHYAVVCLLPVHHHLILPLFCSITPYRHTRLFLRTIRTSLRHAVPHILPFTVFSPVHTRTCLPLYYFLFLCGRNTYRHCVRVPCWFGSDYHAAPRFALLRFAPACCITFLRFRFAHLHLQAPRVLVFPPAFRSVAAFLTIHLILPRLPAVLFTTTVSPPAVWNTPVQTIGSRRLVLASTCCVALFAYLVWLRFLHGLLLRSLHIAAHCCNTCVCAITPAAFTARLRSYCLHCRAGTPLLRFTLVSPCHTTL